MAGRERIAAKPLLIWGARTVLSAAVLAAIFHFVPPGQILAAAGRISPWLWAGALCLFLSGHFVSAMKWRILIGPGPSVAEVFRAHLAGLAANLCLPGVAGGDVVRAGMLIRRVQSPMRLAAGSAADRLLDTVGLGAVAVLGALFAFGPADHGASLGALGLGVALILVAAGFAFAIYLDRRLQGLAMSAKPLRLFAKLVAAAADLGRRPARLAVCLALSVAVQIVFIGVNIAFAQAAGLQAPWAAWAFAWAGAKIIAIAPISLGGLGVREASMAGLMSPFGVATADVVAVGLIWQTVIYASGLIGLVVQVVTGRMSNVRQQEHLQESST